MRSILTIIALGSVLAASALEATFNFNDPTTLNPAVQPPAQKQSVPMDGRSFTDAGVEVSFEATGEGNTQVRLYGSYDAGPDMRVYDGDTMRLRCLDPDTEITGVKAVISLSGETADVWFIPSAGEWVWEEDCWKPSPNAGPVTELALVSYQQSRFSFLFVTTEASTGVAAVSVADAAKPEYFTLTGQPVQNPGAGIYICRRGNEVSKVIVR
ncbi:MAG: hypothetical protein NC418_11675 [Muribaculaceae bacterium]|nr:hypothetical protein [Muribaculaceae bacterium]